MEELAKVIHLLAVCQPQLMQLGLSDQLCLFVDKIDTATSAIKELHDRKLAIDYISNDQMVKLIGSINQASTAEWFTMLHKKSIRPLQIEISYLRQNSDIVIILQVL
jgi:hypothetical protein